MFSVNNFYDYLIHCYSWPVKNNFIWAFKEHGTRDLYKLKVKYNNTDEFEKQVRLQHLENYYGGLHMLDQEPIEFNQFWLDHANNPSTYTIPNYRYDWQDNYSIEEIMTFRFSKVWTPIICHSERNSEEVKYFEDQGFLSVHYWYHGLIARDWFRHWKHFSIKESNGARFGCYIRDMSGTRKYREQVLEFIKEQGNIYCPLLDNHIVDSDSSARINWQDTENFDIQIVPETLFDTQKTHLTEKVLKPVAMEQPFILFAGPNSLEYMRNYGFQTFGCCWDESYDEITNSNDRLEAVTDLVQFLNHLPKNKYNRILNRARLIAENNREHLFSQKFEDILLNELHTNINNALAQQYEDFFTKPGGTFFKTTQILSKYPTNTHPKRWMMQAPYILKHIELEYPNVAKQILKQYPDLF